MAERDLVMACGLSSRMRVRGYFGTIVSDTEDVAWLTGLTDRVNAKRGDFYMIVTFYDPKDTKEKRKRRYKRHLLAMFNQKKRSSNKKKKTKK